MDKLVRYATHDRISMVTLNRPSNLNAINAGLDIKAPLYAARTEVGQRFGEIIRKDGLDAALKWRAAQFLE